MTLTGVHVNKRDRDCIEKSFFSLEQGEYTSSRVLEKGYRDPRREIKGIFRIASRPRFGT